MVENDVDALERALEAKVEALGFEMVEVERGGTRTRPLLRLRIDLPDSRPGRGVTLDDCARVSRAVERVLDEHPTVSERYLLEVSSPGVERPLVRRRDFERFAGRRAALRGDAELAGRARRLEGELLGIEEQGGKDVVRFRLDDGEVVEVPRSEIARAHLVFHWKSD